MIDWRITETLELYRVSDLFVERFEVEQHFAPARASVRISKILLKRARFDQNLVVDSYEVNLFKIELRFAQS